MIFFIFYLHFLLIERSLELRKLFLQIFYVFTSSLIFLFIAFIGFQFVAETVHLLLSNDVLLLICE